MKEFKELPFKEKLLAIIATMLDVIITVLFTLMIIISIPFILVIVALGQVCIFLFAYVIEASDGILEFIEKHSLYKH